MKTMILISVALSAGAFLSAAQTNSTATPPPASTNASAAKILPITTSASTPVATAASTTGDPRGKTVEPSAAKRTAVIEGTNYVYGGIIPRVVGPDRKNPLQLLNPFAPLTDHERRLIRRPLPRSFVDERTVEPVGVTIISVEKK
jgi:ABC-type Fe3+-hydroxamate transport system substrate-binding protein